MGWGEALLWLAASFSSPDSLLLFLNFSGKWGRTGVAVVTNNEAVV